MAEGTNGPNSPPSPWRYAVVGGFASVPLLLGLTLADGIGETLSLTAVLAGGLLAGFLAERRAVAVPPAGAGAGAIGGLVGLGWVLPSLLESARTLTAGWSVPEAALPLAAVFAVVVLAVAAPGDLVGGVVGGWLYRIVAAVAPAGSTV